MPTINRIRIVNIFYDGRIIKDSIFDYYGGRNALMNLNNGGGKTVMIETIFQPIIPGMDIDGWKITDYLTGDQKPLYVMIEWMLDGTKKPSYFMTGICLSKTNVRGDDDKNIKVLKYFTFVHDYDQGNEFDIKNINVSEERDGKNVFYTYNEFYERLKKYKKSHDKFNVYRKEKKQDYREYLKKHHIYENEWALLAKVNQDEGDKGLAGLFDKCKTSDELFDQWILKTVSDMNKDQRQSLIKETASLIKPMIEGGKALAEKELLENVSGDLETFSDMFKEYTEELDKKEEKEKYIAGTLINLKSCIEAEERKSAEAAEIIKKCKEIEKKIKHEELSEQYHGIKRSLDESEDKLKEYDTILPDLSKIHKEAEYKRDCMHAAEYYEKVKAAESKLVAARNTIATLGKGEIAVRKNCLGATIYHHYSLLANSLKSEQERLKREFESKGNEINVLNNRLGEFDSKLSKLNIDKGRLQERCDNFNSAEQEYREQIGELPDRDLTGNLVAESIDELGNHIVSAIKSAETEQERLYDIKNDLENKRNANAQELEQISSDISKKGQQVYDAQNKYDALKNAEAVVAEILSRYDISGTHLYESEENLASLKEKYDNIEAIYQKDIKERDRLKDTFDDLVHGKLHTSPEFADLLIQYDIEFQTGESYLKRQEGDYFDTLLNKNPLLPFCFIVNDKDYDRTLEISQDFGVDRVCPVIRRKSLDMNLEASERSAEIGEIKFYSFYNKDSLHPMTRERYKNNLEDKISELDEKISQRKNGLSKISDDMRGIESFGYSKSDSREIEKSLDDAKADLKKLESRRETLRGNKDHLANELEDTNDAISENEKLLITCQRRDDKYHEYLKAAAKDAENRVALLKALSDIEAVSNSIKDNKEKVHLLSESKNKLEINIETIKPKISSSEDKVAEFAIYSDNEQIDGDIVSLEIEFKELQTLHEGSVSEQQRICSDAEKEKNENQNRLKESFANLTVEDYDITFDVDKRKDLENAERMTYEKLVECRNNKKSEEKEYEKNKVALENKEKEIHRSGFDVILGLSQITGNYYASQIKNDENKNNAEEAEKKANLKINELNSMFNKLEKLIDLDTIFNAGSIKPIDDKIDIEKLRNDLNNSNYAVTVKRNNLANEYKKILDCYAENAEWISQMLSFIDIDNNKSYLDCFKIYEQLCEQRKLLDDSIKVLSSQLQQIENDKNHIIIHMKKHAEFLYEQVKSIADHAYIKIDGKNKRIMQISIPDKLDRGYQDRVSNVIDDTLIRLRKRFESEEIKGDDLLRQVNSFFSDRLLFNAITGSNSVEIKVWKSLEDERNSRLERWESRYSGGEHFLVYFVVYTALVSYARRRQTIDDNDEVRSIFLIDNPFGETSSAHLLDVFIKIVNKFKLQTICFSALKQDSITKNFDLIYQLKLRKAEYSNRSYLETDKEINNAGAEPDKQLDFVSMNRQLSFV